MQQPIYIWIYIYIHTYAWTEQCSAPLPLVDDLPIYIPVWKTCYNWSDWYNWGYYWMIMVLWCYLYLQRWQCIHVYTIIYHFGMFWILLSNFLHDTIMSLQHISIISHKKKKTKTSISHPVTVAFIGEATLCDDHSCRQIPMKVMKLGRAHQLEADPKQYIPCNVGAIVNHPPNHDKWLV